jgi:multiple sugar transport system ATP-binding protein
MAEVILEKLSKAYGGLLAVDRLDLPVRDGESLVLVGPSGCGKTTTLRLIAGLDQPTAGEVRIGGRTVTRLAPKARDVAMLFQHFTLYPHLNVFQNLAFGLQLRRLPRPQIESRVRMAAAMLGIGDLLQRRPAELSGGERQRVALGRCVVRDPQVLLLDEPLSNLDARWRETLQRDLVRLQQQLGTTTIHVTHDQQEAMMMGQRIAVMHAGRIEQIGTPRDVYHAPVNRFVAEFIGSPPMNFLTGRLQIVDDTPTIACPPIRLALPRHRWPAIHSWSGREITLGLRPEDIRTVRPPGDSWEPLRTQVVRCQMRGADAILQLRCGAQELYARVTDDAEPRAGETLEVYLDVARCHLFDPATGQACPVAARRDSTYPSST